MIETQSKSHRLGIQKKLQAAVRQVRAVRTTIFL